MIYRILLCLGIFGVSFGTLHSQQSFARADFSYLVTKNPVFKIGFERQIDSTQFSWTVSGEYGRYASNSQSVRFSSVEDYSLTGGGISGEFKYFFLPEKDEKMYGGFISGFALTRRLTEMRIENLEISSEGYDFQDSDVHLDKGVAFNYGISIGYRSGCVAGPLHLEAVVGYGFGTIQLQDDPTGFRSRATNFISSGDYIRLEMNLVVDL